MDVVEINPNKNNPSLIIIMIEIFLVSKNIAKYSVFNTLIYICYMSRYLLIVPIMKIFLSILFAKYKYLIFTITQTLLMYIVCIKYFNVCFVYICFIYIWFQSLKALSD